MSQRKSSNGVLPKQRFRLLPKFPPFHRISPLEPDNSPQSNQRRSQSISFLETVDVHTLNGCDLDEQVACYAAYHNNTFNVAIHMIFFCPILFTTLVFTTFTPAFLPTPLPFGPFPGHEYVVFNFSFFLAAFYAFYFITLDRKAGWLAALFSLSCWISANAFVDHLGGTLAWKVALVLHGFAWLNQFLGHGVFQGQAPALLDNIAQAVLMAPFFVVFELLIGFFRHEPSPGFSRNLAAKVKYERELSRKRMKENTVSLQD